jgi:hypothetical protein
MSPLESLRISDAEAMMYATAQLNGLDSEQHTQEIVELYIAGPHLRLPILVARRRYAVELVHAMYLFLQRPHGGSSMTSLLYFRTKTLITMLEATKGLSLQVLQARILLAYYEVDHGLTEAGTSSVAACAKMCRFLGISPRVRIDEPIATEEMRRAWWALYNIDR